VDEIVLVEEEEIAQSIVSLLERTKLLVEGAGAVPLAALLHGKVRELRGKTICLLSGGNIDVKTIAQVVERGLLAAGRYLKLTVELDDMTGALERILRRRAPTYSTSAMTDVPNHWPSAKPTSRWNWRHAATGIFVK
jgi:threonine synthase